MKYGCPVRNTSTFQSASSYTCPSPRSSKRLDTAASEEVSTTAGVLGWVQGQSGDWRERQTVGAAPRALPLKLSDGVRGPANPTTRRRRGGKSWCRAPHSHSGPLGAAGARSVATPARQRSTVHSFLALVHGAWYMVPVPSPSRPRPPLPRLSPRLGCDPPNPAGAPHPSRSAPPPRQSPAAAAR